ncbi:protein sickie-like isoform X2 [Planococcus citri]|uniref:protein sickie-like isoform X2 n=1 Tax=Planococcus citri TaxID=170843 RepID=UPI0031F7C0C4
MAACISRGPKTTSANQHTLVTTHATGCTQQQQQYNQIIKIYTEWGNHYLEKARFKKLIQNLQSDLTDGVLLADVVEAVCGQKVPDINRKPKTPVNMVENIVNCLTLLERIGVTLDGITAKDVREGNLKTTLGLFFALSKYKQQQKQRQTTQSILLTPERQQQKRQHLAPPSEDMKQSKLPSPHYNHQSTAVLGNSGTNIPTPISQRQSRALAPGLNSLKCSSSNNSSRSASPSHSFIPTPKSGQNARSSLNEKQLTSIRNKIPTVNSSYNASLAPNGKISMNDKVKGLNAKEKNKSIVGLSNSSISSAKRTSSSSGVSSTRSERSSDSSNSTCNEVRSSFSDQKENHVSFTVNEVKPMLRKKVVVKPTENRAVKLPGKTNPLKIEEKTSQESSINSNKEDRKSAMNESSRLSGSGIPKPTAAVKGTAKPTNSVAPMIVKHETEEKPINNVEEINVKKNDVEKPHPKFEAGNHSKQSSIGEDEDTLANIKPMEPLLRGYKRGVVLPHRITVPANGFIDNQQRILNNYHAQQYHYLSKSDVKKGSDRDNYEINSGYVSDGDVLQSNVSMSGKLYNDVDGGYMSEGGAQFYERYSNNLEMKLKALKKSEASKANNLSSISGSTNIKQTLNDRSHSTDVLTALSTGSPLHKFGNKLNGRGPGPDEGPISPPEPTPTHAGSYNTSFRTSPPHMSPPEPTPVVYRVIGARSHIKKSDNSQQTDNSAFSRQSLNNSSGQWKKYTDSEMNSESNRMTNSQCPENVRIRDKRSPSAGPSSNTNSLLRSKVDKRRTSSTSSATGSREELMDMEYYNGERKSRVDGKSKVRGVPSSFGYVKKSTNTNGKESRTAQVSAVPRTKVKVSGGTQTDIKSYSLSSTTASQLSQCVRERIMMGQDSIPKSPSRTQNAHKTVDRDSLPGSLSDSTYTDLQIMSNQHNSWFRHGSPYTASLPTRSSANDADSIESLPAQLHHRASLTNARFISGTSPSSSNVPSRLSRSNSISYLRERTFPRSTKSEKLYPSMLQRSDELEPLYSIPYGMSGSPGHMNNCNSQDEPPSPTPSHLSQGTSVGNSSRYHYTASPSSNQSFNRNSPYMNFLTKMNSKEDDMHGSAMSLVSTASSSLYSTPEDKQAQEMRRLKKDLSEAQQKVHTLTSQLSTNAHVVSAFEKSLSNMTQRLQQLTATAEKKDSELMELRQTIEALRKQSGGAENTTIKEGTPTHNNCSPSLARRHTINTTIDSNPNNNISRQLSTDSMSSLVSMSSACSMSSGNQLTELDKNKKKGGWLRSSFSKAFSRSKKNRNGSLSDVEDSRTTQSNLSAPSSPLLNSPHPINGNISDEMKSNGSTMKNSQSSSELYENNNDRSINDNEYSPELVLELKKQLREKDLVLTDIRLEALSSAHQLESLKDTVIKMRNEMLNLKQDNERLQRIVTSKSLASSQSSLQTHDSMDRRYSTTDVCNDRTELDMMFTENADMDAKKVAVWVFFGAHGSYNKYVEERNECPISLIPVSTKTNWEALDNLVFRAFKEYLDRTDPNTNLGLSQDSIWSYHVGEIVRYKDSKEPELLPCGYLVGGSSSSITVCLKGALHSGSLDALAFEMLIPKSIIQRYITLLAEHRKIMLCGPTGTGKTYLANKLAEYLLYSDGKEITVTSVVNFCIDEKNSKDLRQYLLNIAEQCENKESSENTNIELPSVIILDNLHQASSLNEILNILSNFKCNKFTPYVIGTLNQSTYSSTDLQLHQNFRWILCANHLEPVKGFLSRYLRRRLIEVECKKGAKNTELWRIIDWIPKVQHHLNQFLETHASSDVTIGPKLFMSCPMEVDGSQVWFTDLWNYSLVPYLHDAVKDCLQLHGKRAPWEDPTQFIIRNYPWSKSTTIHGGIEALMRLRPEDVGYEVKSESDPLLNMLMTLQEAANYTSSTHNISTESTNGPVLTTNCNNSTI